MKQNAKQSFKPVRNAFIFRNNKKQNGNIALSGDPITTLTTTLVTTHTGKF